MQGQELSENYYEKSETSPVHFNLKEISLKGRNKYEIHL